MQNTEALADVIALESRARDLRAVMHRLGSQRAGLLRIEGEAGARDRLGAIVQLTAGIDSAVAEIRALNDRLAVARERAAIAGAAA